jgi:hypothetical protein
VPDPLNLSLRPVEDRELGLQDDVANPPASRYRATFKHRFNEAEPPRTTEFHAAPSAAKAEALRQSRSNEVVVDVVPLT